MGISFQFKASLSPRMYIQTQLVLKGIKCPGPFHFVSIEDISASSEGLDPTARMFVCDLFWVDFSQI